MGVSGANRMIFGETKTISQWKWRSGRNGIAPIGQKCIENPETKTFQSFGNIGSRSISKPKAALHKSSDTMFRFTFYSQKIEHLEQPLHT